MRGKMREKLMQLIKYAERKMTYEEMIDYLIANGVVVLPCKVGDVVFVIPTKENRLTEIVAMRCIGFSLGEPNDTMNLATDKNKLYQPSFDKFGKTVFLTKAGAEEAFERSQQ